MEFKLNEHYLNRSSHLRKNDFFRRFKEPFTVLLSKKRNHQKYPAIQSIYVENKEIHTTLDELLKSEIDEGTFLIGLTGIGKTTTIKGFFNIEKNGAVINDDMLIISLFIDGVSISHVDELEDRFGGLFWSACNQLEKLNPEIKQKKSELYEFIESNSPITIGNFIDPLDDSPEVTMKHIAVKSKRTYYIELLKFYLADFDIKYVTIIIDDIESIRDVELRNETINKSVKSWECLQNNDSGYHSKIILSERPETYKHFIYENEWFSAFGINEAPIHLDAPPSLSKIFKKRFDELAEDDFKSVTNKESWEEAYDILMQVCNGIEDVNVNVIPSLCNLNYRKSFDVLLELLTTGFWFQKEENLNPYFQITADNYRKPVLPLIIHAIGYKNNQLYVNDTNQLIPNIFYNKRATKYPLLMLRILTFFLESNRKTHKYSIASRKAFIQKFSKCMIPAEGESLLSAVNDSFDYLVDRKLLLVASTDDGTQDDLLLSPRGEIIWTLLGEYNSLLAMFRDDLWLTKEEYTEETLLNLPQKVGLLELLKLVKTYLLNDKKLISTLKGVGALNDYKQLFGYFLPSVNIANGVQNSITRLYKSQHEKIPDNLLSLFHEVISLKDELFQLHQG
jgi:hypothetical protein